MVTESKAPEEKKPKPKRNRNRNRANRVHVTRFGKKIPASARYEFIGNNKGVPGVTGLKALAGIVSEEYLAKLKSWTTLSKIYIQMRDDITVATLLNALKLPILGAGVSVETAPGGSQADEQAAEWLEAVMHSMHKQTWYSHMEDQLEMLDFGFAIGEIVLEKRSDGRMWVKNISPRGQETLYKWEFNDRGQAELFRQRDPNKGTMIDIPLSRCVHSVYKGRKGNPQGWSLLRVLHRPWRMVHDLENLEVIGMERDVGGMPVATITEAGIKLESSELDDLKSNLEAMRNDEAAYAVLPYGVTLTPFQGSTKIFNWGAAIERKKKEILMSMFAQFLTLGMQQVGTQALVKGSQDFFTLAVESIQQYLAESWNQQLVPYLFMFNSFPGMTGLPVIKLNTVGMVDISGLISSYSTAVATRLLTPVDEDEDYMRDILNLPKLPEEERGMPRDVEQPPMPGMFEMKGKGQSDNELERERMVRTLVEEVLRQIDDKLSEFSVR